MTETRRRVAVPDLDFLPLISAGVITAETMVWTEGMDEWAAAGEIHPELFGDASAPASTDLPTVLQMVRSISAPIGRASAALRISSILLVTVSITLGVLIVLCAWMGAQIYGGRGWFVLLGLIPAAIPALFSLPLAKVAVYSRTAHMRLDRGAFYAMSRSLARIAWLGVLLTVVILAALGSVTVLAIIYRAEIMDFVTTALSES